MKKILIYTKAINKYTKHNLVQSDNFLNVLSSSSRIKVIHLPLQKIIAFSEKEFILEKNNLPENYINYIYSELSNYNYYKFLLFTSINSVCVFFNAVDQDSFKIWKNKIVFSIGKSTTHYLLSLGFTQVYTSDVSHSIGMKKWLKKFFLNDPFKIIKKNYNNKNINLLFLASCKASNVFDQFPCVLNNKKINLIRLNIYDVLPNLEVKHQLLDTLIKNYDLLALSSPSATKILYEWIKCQTPSTIKKIITTLKLCSIGKTTTQAINHYFSTFPMIEAQNANIIEYRKTIIKHLAKKA